MPNPVRKAAKKSASAKRQGGRYKKAATRVAKKSNKTAAKASTSGKRTQQVKARTQSQTARNLDKAGDKALASGKKPAKRSSLKVTPQSAHRKQTASDPYYSDSKRSRKVSKRG